MGFSRQEHWTGLPFPLQCMKVKSESEVAQLCPTLSDPMDCSLPGSSIHGILQARTLDWAAISFSNAWKWKVKVKSLSCVRLLATPWTAAHQAPLSMGFSRQGHWSGMPLPSPSLILHNKPFFNQIVTCDEKWILYNNQQWPTQWLDQEEAPEHFSKPNLNQKNVTVTVWWPAAHLTHYSFRNPGETITSEKYVQQINEMHQKLQHL